MSKLDPAIVWNGFHFRWEKYPHRLSLLGSRFHPVWSDAKELNGFDHELKVKIGNWPPERADYNVPYHLMYSQEHFIAKATTEVVVSCMIEEGTTVTQRVELAVSDMLRINPLVDLEDTHQIAVLLNGFNIQSVNNQSGWHFGGLGIELKGPAEIKSGKVSFDLEIYARPARAPEPLPHGNKDWNAKTACQYCFHVDHLIVAGPADKLWHADTLIEKADKNAGIRFENDLVTTIQGMPGAFEHAIPGISGFKFKLSAHDKSIFKKRSGRYMREIGFLMQDAMEYDQVKGKGRLKVSTRFANDGERVRYLANKMMLESYIKLDMLQLNGLEKVQRGNITGQTQKRLLEQRKPISLDDKKVS